MEKTYLWFALKLNIFLFFIGLIVMMLSGIFLWPLSFIFALSSSILVKAIVLAVVVGLVSYYPHYFAFKTMYRSLAREHKLVLKEAILYTVGLQLVIGLIDFNFFQEDVDGTYIAVVLLIRCAIASLAFYFAGLNYQPAMLDNSAAVAKADIPTQIKL